MIRAKGGDTYTKEELIVIIDKMKRASNLFYGMATATACHAFVEFCGLMNEYIRLCEDAVSQDIDFTTATQHAGQPLPMKDYHARYLGEKIGCIYGPALQNPELLKAFLEQAGLMGHVVDARRRIPHFQAHWCWKGDELQHPDDKDWNTIAAGSQVTEAGLIDLISKDVARRSRRRIEVIIRTYRVVDQQSEFANQFEVEVDPAVHLPNACVTHGYEFDDLCSGCLTARMMNADHEARKG